MKCSSCLNAFLVAGLALSCTRTDRRESSLENNQGAVLAPQENSYTQKPVLVDQMKKDMSDLQKEMDDLSAQVEKTNDAAKADAKVKLEALRQKWEQAKNRLDQAENSTEVAWNDTRAGFRAAFNDLQDSIKNMRQWLSDKIQP